MNERLVGAGGGGRSLLRAGMDFKSGGTDTCFLSWENDHVSRTRWQCSLDSGPWPLIVHAFVAFPSLSCFHWWQLFSEMLNCSCANTYHTLKHLLSWPCLGDKRYVNSRNINNQKVDFRLYYFYNKYKYNIQNFAWNNQVSNINGKPSIWSQFLEDPPSTSHCRSASPVPVSNPSLFNKATFWKINNF